MDFPPPRTWQRSSVITVSIMRRPAQQRPSLWLLLGPALGTLAVGLSWASAGKQGDRPLWLTLLFIFCLICFAAMVVFVLWRRKHSDSDLSR